MRERDGDVGGERLQDDFGVDGGIGGRDDAGAEDVGGREERSVDGEVGFIGDGVGGIWWCW